ncbi:low density lipoprotein receptor adapter protein 1-like [Plakobranchus ocellatus]|uniref:Low density lipoprotein receptor adapter protein 1-like n=1 Tax=Plakobranchus ocellatus TaxID=259542 RepID=A0AAV4B423_9GAST|nr:low density lipoprotein receptor adapter protein 1-like [Plakobranchus ocellatus]
MDALLRAVKKPQMQGSPKHSKVPEGWAENKEPVNEGITFYLKYIGSTLVEELEDDQTYGDGISSKAVHNIILMAKAANRKLLKTALTVSGRGIRTVDMTTNQVMFDSSIYRVCFCTADKIHDKVFAYIARNTTNETMECYAFLCAKMKIAQAVTLTVSQAFSVAQDRWLEHKRLKRTLRQEAQRQKESAKAATKSEDNKKAKTEQLLTPLSSPATHQARFVSPESSPAKKQDCLDSRKNWEIFDDPKDDEIDDMFSQLAENRSKPLPSFGTDLVAAEIDDSVHKYMEGSACYEAFSWQKSLEDLLDL